MDVDIRLAKKGQAEPREGLVQQGKVSVALARAHAEALVGGGWPATKTEALAKGVATLEASATAKHEAADRSRAASVAEHAAAGDAKRFLRRLRNALPAASREAGGEVGPEAFRAGGPLGRSTRKLSAHLRDIRPAVVKLDAALAPYFGGLVASAELDRVRTALDAADSAQEVAIATLPAETLEVYEAKGRVLELVEDLNRAAKIAFDGDAVTIAQFNKDIVLRARAKRAKAEEPATAPVA